jgi:hypothetical protein
MGFWSELGQLAKDIGGDFKQLGSEVKEITSESVDEFKNDPAKYTMDAVKDVGAVAVPVALAVGTIAAKVAWEVGKGVVEKSKNAQEAAASQTDEQLLRGLDSKNIMTLGATSAEVQKRGLMTKDEVTMVVKTNRLDS